jgi:hypothetical protein
MRKRSKPHQLVENLEREKVSLEARLVALPEGDERAIIKRKLFDIEAARTMNVWLTVKV